AVVAEVDPPDVAGRDVEAPLGVAPDAAVLTGNGRLEQPPDLGGDHVLVPRAAPERVAQPALGQPEAVVRRGVEGPDPAVPRRVYGGPRVLLAHRRTHAADGRAPRGPPR